MSYYTVQEAQNSMAVLAGWMSENSKIKVSYHSGKRVDANIDTGEIRIPALACATGIPQEALQLLRAMVYHESGHIAETKLAKSDTPHGAKFKILNALEDRRMERVLAEKHLGCKDVFGWAQQYFNKKIAGQIAEQESAGAKGSPLWEALCAMSFQFEGHRPVWRLTDKAEAYFNAAYDEFSKVRFAKSTQDSLEIAEKVYEILKEASEDFNKDKQEQEQGQGQESKDGGESEDGKDKQSTDGSDDSEEESKKEESKKEESKKEESKKEESKKEESKKEESKKEDGEDGKDEGGEEEGESKGSGSDDLDEDGEDGDSKDSGDDDGGESEGVQSEDGKESDGESEGKNKVDDKDSRYDPKDGEEKSGNDKKECDKEEKPKPSDLDEEAEGEDLHDSMNSRLNELLDEIPAEDARYLSCKEKDVHRIPVERDGDRAQFQSRRDEVAVSVSSMTRALEQALRSMAKIRREPYLRHGKIDKKRLVAISKSLSKEVFFRSRHGEALNSVVSILIDESGSMYEVIKIQRLAIAMGESLSLIGIPFEIIGTTTLYGASSYSMPPLNGMQRTNPIDFRHYKSFEEDWMVVRNRITHITSDNHNIDGENIEYAASRLAQRTEHRKIIFSLSDGRPESGQGNNEMMGFNLKRVCQRCRKNGIEVYGFGIGTEEPKKYYGEKNFVYLNQSGEMGDVFVRKFADVVTGGKVRV